MKHTEARQTEEYLNDMVFAYFLAQPICSSRFLVWTAATTALHVITTT